MSVSRLHCTFLKIGQNIYLQDEWSKFGTMINLKETLKIKPDSCLEIQSGKCLFTITLGNVKCCSFPFWNLELPDYGPDNNEGSAIEMEFYSLFVDW